MERPCAVIANCVTSSPSESAWSPSSALDTLICCMLGVDSLPTGQVVADFTTAFELSLSTKYYTSDVWLCRMNSRHLGDEHFADSVEAVVLLFDGISTDTADPWLPVIQQWNPEVRLLVCQRLYTASKPSVTAWCLKHSFELVELDPDQETLAEINEYRELYGTQRIVQALRSHAWSNAQIKEDDLDEQRKRLMQFIKDDDEQDEADLQKGNSQEITDSAVSVNENPQSSTFDSSQEFSSASKSKDDKHSKKFPTRDDILRHDDEGALLRAVNGTDNEEVSFEEMFAKFADMKANADAMPFEQRKAYAEKVTIAFWKAIGGEEDELDGLDSDRQDTS